MVPISVFRWVTIRALCLYEGWAILIVGHNRPGADFGSFHCIASGMLRGAWGIIECIHRTTFVEERSFFMILFSILLCPRTSLRNHKSAACASNTQRPCQIYGIFVLSGCRPFLVNSQGDVSNVPAESKDSCPLFLSCRRGKPQFQQFLASHCR